MAPSKWLCAKNVKNMQVKIVHPGGHVELHDGPVLAAEIILRNPRCCVAYPYVFQQPWAIVAPDTMLMPGEKFYVVPMSTVRKLQRLALKYSPSNTSLSPFPSPDLNIKTIQQPSNKEKQEDNKDRMENSNCWSSFGSGTRKRIQREMENDNCFVCFLKGKKLSPEIGGENSRSSSSFESSEMRELMGRRRVKEITRGGARGSPKRLASHDHWQPSLESIVEE